MVKPLRKGRWWPPLSPLSPTDEDGISTYHYYLLQARTGAGWGQLTWKVAETRREWVGVVVGVVAGLVVAAVLVTAVVYRDRLLKALRKRTLPR